MNPELRLSIPVVDYHHEKIFRFFENLKRRAPTKPEIIQAIGDYTGRHFVVEEELMLAHGYPGFDEHKRQHEFFKGKIGTLLEAMGRDEIAASKAIAEYLEVWLTKHVQTSDKAMAEYFHHLGVRSA